MARVALVTGGTRGIGAAIAVALKAAGYTVAANYGGNDEAAKAFTAATGIAAYKWDVSSYDACVAGIAQVEAAHGPVDVLVNNAGITRDVMFHKMTKEHWDAVINTNLSSLFNMTRPVWEGPHSPEAARSADPARSRDDGSDDASSRKARTAGACRSIAIFNCAGLLSRAIAPPPRNGSM